MNYFKQVCTVGVKGFVSDKMSAETHNRPKVYNHGKSSTDDDKSRDSKRSKTTSHQLTFDMQVQNEKD